MADYVGGVLYIALATSATYWACYHSRQNARLYAHKRQDTIKVDPHAS